MFILDSLLIGSLRFVLDKIVAAAEAESTDDSALRESIFFLKLLNSTQSTGTYSPTPRAIIFSLTLTWIKTV